MPRFPLSPLSSTSPGFEYWDNVIANDLDHYGGIAGHPTALTEGRAKGQKVVGLLQKMQAQESVEA